MRLLVILGALTVTTAKTNTASGGVCERGLECLDTEYCDFFNVCRPRKSQGEYCTGDQLGDQLCSENLICDQRDHMCVLPVPKCGNNTACPSGEYCDTEGTKLCYPVACNSDIQCSARYFCQTKNTSRIGECTKQAGEGESCSTTFPCSQGLRCQDGSCVGTPTPARNTTAPPRGSKKAGIACTRELDCEIGLYCKNGDPRFKDTGNCTMWTQEGQTCDEATLCVQGQFCVVQRNYGDAGICIPYQEKGYAKVRPGSTRWIAEGRPQNRTAAGFGMQDAGSIPIYANGPGNYGSLAPTLPPKAKSAPRFVAPAPTRPNIFTLPPSPSLAPSAQPSPPTPRGKARPPSSQPSSPPSEDFPVEDVSLLSLPPTVPPTVGPRQAQLPRQISQPNIAIAAPVQVPVPLPAQQTGFSVERRDFGTTPAVPNNCCNAVTALCISCQLRVSVEAFCIANPSVSGCPTGAAVLPAPQPVRAPVAAPVATPLRLPTVAAPAFSTTFATTSIPASQPLYVPNSPVQTQGMFPPLQQAFTPQSAFIPPQPTYIPPQPVYIPPQPTYIPLQQSIPSQPIYSRQLPATTSAGPAALQTWPG